MDSDSDNSVNFPETCEEDVIDIVGCSTSTDMNSPFAPRAVEFGCRAMELMLDEDTAVGSFRGDFLSSSHLMSTTSEAACEQQINHIHSIHNEQFCTETTYGHSSETLGVSHTCQVVCDGIWDNAMPVRLADRHNSRQWIPRRIAENSPLQARMVSSIPEIYAWYVNDSTEYFVFGFKDLRGSGKYYYAAVVDEGYLLLSSNFDPPYTIKHRDLADDPRVMRYYRSSHSGQYVLRPTKYPDHFINIVNGYVRAERTEDIFATAWSLDSL